jgi:hypothetical protein
MNNMKSVVWPLLFTYKGPIIGNGFLSNVELCGKLLAFPETEGVWIDGVNPGAFALGAATLDVANRELREALTRVLVDFAGTAESFASVKAATSCYGKTYRTLHVNHGYSLTNTDRSTILHP